MEFMRFNVISIDHTMKLNLKHLEEFSGVSKARENGKCKTFDF